MSDYSEDDFEEDDDTGTGSVRLKPCAPEDSPQDCQPKLESGVSQAPEQAHYKAAKAPDGREYWYNTATNETTWDLKTTLTKQLAAATASLSPTSSANTEKGAPVLDMQTSSLIKRRAQAQHQQLLDSQPDELGSGQAQDTPSVSPIRSANEDPPSPSISHKRLSSKAVLQEFITKPCVTKMDEHDKGLESSDFSDISDVYNRISKNKEESSQKTEVGGQKPSLALQSVRSTETVTVCTAHFRSAQSKAPKQQEVYPLSHVTPSQVCVEKYSASEPSKSELAALPLNNQPSGKLKAETDTLSPKSPTRSTEQSMLLNSQRAGLQAGLLQAYTDLLQKKSTGDTGHLCQPLRPSGVTLAHVRHKPSYLSLLDGPHHGDTLEDSILDLVLLLMTQPGGSAFSGDANSFQPTHQEVLRRSARPEHHIQHIENENTLSRVAVMHQKTSAVFTTDLHHSGFQEPGSLLNLCTSNLDKFVLRHLGHSTDSRQASDNKGTAERAILLDLLGVFLQIMQHQGSQKMPAGLYYVKFVGAPQNRQLVQSVLHSLPFEMIRHPQGIQLTFRLEFWLTRDHIIECALALQLSLKKIDSRFVQATDPLQPPPLCWPMHHAKSVFELNIVSNKEEDPPSSQADASLQHLVNDDLLAHFMSSVKLQAQAQEVPDTLLTGPLLASFVGEAIHGVLLDEVVQKVVISQSLKKMGLKKSRGRKK